MWQDCVSAGVFLALANLPALPPEEVRAALDVQRAALEAQFSAVQAKHQLDRQAAGQLPAHVEAMFSYSEAMLAADVNWIKPYLGRIKEK